MRPAGGCVGCLSSLGCQQGELKPKQVRTTPRHHDIARRAGYPFCF
jgi:hypothetical protein